MPARENPEAQEWFEAKPGEDPLAVADALGRPVAILRLGGRLPETTDQPDANFFFGCPPFVCYRSEPVKAAEKATPQPLPALTANAKNPEVQILSKPPKQVPVKSAGILEGSDAMIHIPIDSLPSTPVVKNDWRGSDPNQEELHIRYTGGLFSTVLPDHHCTYSPGAMFLPRAVALEYSLRYGSSGWESSDKSRLWHG